MNVVRSFDFWDTLITRLVVRPIEIFSLVERISGVQGFAQARFNAERLSRIGINETSLDRIYSYLSYDSENKDMLKQLERNLEIGLSCPITENIKRFQSKDIVLSDMYLSTADILEIARNCGFTLTDDRLFISCEIGVTKHQGGLFAHALSTFKIISHEGDNRHSDVKMAKKYKIKASHYQDQELNKVEKSWALLPNYAGNLAGVLRGSRLACPYENYSEKVQWRIFSQIVAPVLVGFIDWLFDDCEKRGIEDIYFLSRDGQILHKIALKLCEARNLSFNCKYIYASRQALHLPGHTSIDESESWILDDTSHLSLATLADRTGILIDEVINIVSPWVSVDPNKNLDTSQRAALKKAIRSTKFTNALDMTANVALRNASKYYSDMGLLSLNNDHKSAVVDVGWNGRIQRSLENIIRKNNGETKHLHGYYISISKKCVYESGERIHGYLSDPFIPLSSATWVDSYRGMIELFLGADHPSVLSFKPIEGSTEINPVFGRKPSLKQLELVGGRQNAILNFVDYLLKYEKFAQQRIFIYKEEAVTQLYRMLSSPSRDEVKSFSHDLVSEDQVERNFISVSKNISIADLVLNTSPNRWGCWLEGSLSLSGLLWLLKFKRHILNIKHLLIRSLSVKIY